MPASSSSGDFDAVPYRRSSSYSSSETSPLRTSLLYDSERYHTPSYTKLEVISAKQIRAIIRTFHSVVIVALVTTIISVILCNHLFIVHKPYPINSQLLTQEQYDSSYLIDPSASSASNSSSSRASGAPAGKMKLASTMRETVGIPDMRIANHATDGNVWWDENSIHNHFQCFYRANGMHNVLSVRVRGPGLDCCAKHDPCYRHWAKYAQCTTGSDDGDRDVAGDDDGVLRISTLIREENSVYNGTYVFFPMRLLVPSPWYVSIAQFLLVLGGLLLLFLATLFVIRLVRAGRCNLSQEQIFSCMLLFCSALYFNIPTALFRLHEIFTGRIDVRILNGKEVSGNLPQWLLILENPLRALRINLIGPFFIFYLWANIHAFAVLDPKERLTARFYMPKILLLAPYCFIKLMAFFRSSIHTSETPFISAIVLLHSYRKFLVWRAQREMCIYTIILTCFEVVFLMLLIVQLVRTNRILQKAPYMFHRSKQIGFRFFAYLAAVYVVTLYALQIFLIVARPVSEIVASDSFNFGVQLIGIRPEHCVGPIILTFMYVVISAFVNLPYDSIGVIRGWFQGTELAPSSSTWSQYSTGSGKAFDNSGMGSMSMRNPKSSKDGGISINSRSGPKSGRTSPKLQKPTFIVDKDYELLKEIVEPFTYRKRESNDSLELKANCFTMQTHVIMFNFAWYVYYYGTEKLENFEKNLSESVLPFSFHISEGISELETDTHALVVDGTDRIIVSFKGTTSKRNLRTSMKIYHEHLVNVVPTDIDGVNELERLRIVFGRAYEQAKIHKGFAAAYASVAHRVMRRIKKLHDERPRPIFLTGHSLGGALATICSLDIWIKLRISRRQIFVSTFGSPRVGNEPFKKIYDSVIALHWRIVVDTDMIAKLPKGLYRHVGKKVLITPHGQMFIDPWELQLKLWSGSTAGLAYHRKASYLLAIRAWCVKNHKKTYMPAFWPFPVREDDKQRFDDVLLSFDDEDAGAYDKEDPKSGISVITSSIDKNSAARRIMHRDTMVESLNSGTEGCTLAVEKWERMARRLLLKSKLSQTVSQT